MDRISAFGVVWTGLLLLMMVVSVSWAVNDLRTGSARFNMMFGDRVRRDEEPFEFWLAVGSKFLALPVGAFMLWFASDIFWKH